MNQDRKERIWQVISAIPAGKVASYGQVARLAELPGYARYVGYILGNLPSGTRLPWHRVVNTQGKISFKPGSRQYLTQKSLLEQEGVVFLKGRLSMARYRWCQDDV